MNSANWVLLLFFFSLVSASSNLSLDVQQDGEREKIEVGLGLSKLARRALIDFKEKPNGGNVTYDCSPSGPCVPCAYSEKSDEKYRCSETGYRIPLKCVKVESSSKKANGKKKQNDRSALESSEVEVKHAKEFNSSVTQRSLLDDSSSSEGGNQVYITYRSCVPAVNEERLSVLGFEGIMLGLLLMSGSAIYFRRKRANPIPSGAVRVPNNSRF
ncbi:hypothetical protein M9H77_10072 [Catharanthus roseus]|uniref:Uncharacterized protein n=1 Tax=Catharanthus roseus TaxID=4058 RepID=A0ACC0C2R8_CATRO|nr:hypothetical protein M9H77_10072 [Catharanthus roseus]